MATGRTNATTSVGGPKVYTPVYTGNMNLVYTNAKQTGGYIEFTSSGTLTWAENTPPKKSDLFCVGGGGGGSNPTGNDIYYYQPGAAGSGFVKTITDAALTESTDITIGAGGANSGTRLPSNRGGTTSIGNLCTAEGGFGAGNGSTTRADIVKGGNGGSGGAGGGTMLYDPWKSPHTISRGGNGGSNGGNGTRSTISSGTGTAGAPGSGSGISTKDLIGRMHAGGGARTQDSDMGGHTYPGGVPGASDFEEGKGSGAYGGGGYGGGASNGGTGGQGFAMIAWGTYKEDLGLT